MRGVGLAVPMSDTTGYYEMTLTNVGVRGI